MIPEMRREHLHMLLTRGEEIRFEAGDLFPENILLFSCVLACGLHAIDRANEFWEIEVLQRSC